MDTTIMRSKALPYRSCIYGMVLSVCTLFTLKLYLGHVPFMLEFLFSCYLSSIHLMEVIQYLGQV